MLLQIIVCCVVLLVLFVLFSRYRGKQMRTKQLQAMQQLFQDTGLPIPELTFGTSFGWDTFNIIFASEQEFMLAKRNGVIDKFKQHLATYYKPGFRADMAVACLYPGMHDEWLKQVKSQ